MRPPFNANDPLALRPIGFVRSGKQLKFETRHQATEALPEESILELLPDPRFELALHDLEGFSHVWLIWWFHRNASWRPKVLPPRGPAQRRGVFATRSPHRPNPLGLSVVPLLGVSKRQLLLGPHDLVDGTPVFDIKPYIPAYDAFADASQGWLDEADAWQAAPADFDVRFSELASLQAEWLRSDWDIDFRPRLRELLSRDPSPHSGRRIRPRGASQFEIGCGAWRAVFTVSDNQVHVQALEAGYPRRYLLDESRPDIPDRAAQLAHLARWPDQPDRAR